MEKNKKNVEKSFYIKKSLYLCKLIKCVKMDRKVDTRIQFSGLKPGTYEFSYELDGEFFKGFENAELSDGRVDFEVKLERKERLMMFDFRFKGEVETVCDRCLGPLTVEVEGEETLCVKFGEDSRSEDENVVFLPESAYEIDLGQNMYEYVVVSMPMVHYHPTGEDGKPMCDPEMLKYIGTEEESQEKPADVADPRWEALKALKDENK